MSDELDREWKEWEAEFTRNRFGVVDPEKGLGKDQRRETTWECPKCRGWNNTYLVHGTDLFCRACDTPMSDANKTVTVNGYTDADVEIRRAKAREYHDNKREWEESPAGKARAASKSRDDVMGSLVIVAVILALLFACWYSGNVGRIYKNIFGIGGMFGPKVEDWLAGPDGIEGTADDPTEQEKKDHYEWRPPYKRD